MQRLKRKDRCAKNLARSSALGVWRGACPKCHQNRACVGSCGPIPHSMCHWTRTRKTKRTKVRVCRCVKGAALLRCCPTGHRRTRPRCAWLSQVVESVSVLNDPARRARETWGSQERTQRTPHRFRLLVRAPQRPVLRLVWCPWTFLTWISATPPQHTT